MIKQIFSSLCVMTILMTSIGANAQVLAGGAYTITEGDTLTVVSVGSNITPGVAIANTGYLWDINNDGVTDGTGSIVLFLWSQIQTLLGFGPAANNTTIFPVTLKVIDESGSMASAATTLSIKDFTGTVAITTQTVANTIYTGVLPITWTVNEPADGDLPISLNMHASKDGIIWYPLFQTNSMRNGSNVLLLNGLPAIIDGTGYTLRATLANNSQHISQPFSIDRTAPVIAGPTAYTIAEGQPVTFNLGATTDAIAGVSGYNRGFLTSTGTNTGLVTFTRAQIQSLGITNDGTYSIPVTVSDKVGNISSTNITLTITNTPPAVSIVSPTGIISGTNTITRTATDPAASDNPLHVSIRYVNSLTSGTILSGTSFASPTAWDTTTIPDGTGYQLIVKAMDDDTSTTFTGTTFSIDNTPPVVMGWNTGVTINEASGLMIDLRATTDALAGMSGTQAGYVLTINGIAAPFSNTGYWNIARNGTTGLNTYGIINGMNQVLNISVKAFDSISNNVLKTGSLTVMNVVPTITLSSPSTIAGIGVFAWTGTDPVDTLVWTTLDYSANGTTWTVLASGAASTFTGFGRNTLSPKIADGIYTIRVRMTDDVGTGVITKTITIKNDPDVVKTSSSSNGFAGGGGYNGGSSTTTTVSQPTTTVTTPTTQPTKFLQTGLPSNTCSGVNVKTNIMTMTSTQRQKQVVCWLYNNKQTIYKTPATFSYNTPITRAQAAKFMTVFVQDMLAKTKVLDIKQAKRVCTFNDRNMIMSESLKSYMYQSCEYGIFQGTSSNNFMPKNNLTQAQAIAVVVRSLSSQPINESGYAPWYKGYADALASKNLGRKGYTTKDMVAFKTTSITRGQLGELLYSVMNHKANK